MPNPPNEGTEGEGEMEEQLVQVLEAILRIEPENSDLSNLSFEFLITYTFMATNTPINTEVMFVRMNPAIASSGR